MAYICNDCGNRSSRRFPGGKCPACDSFNIRGTAMNTRQALREKEPKTLFELLLMLLLWGALGYGVWDRFLRDAPAADTPAAAPALKAPDALMKKLGAPAMEAE
jgi:hypothetical protein